MRVIGRGGSNRRVDADNSVLLATEASLHYVNGDVNAGIAPLVVHTAYDYRPGGRSTLYGIDSGTNSLVRIGGENGQPSPDTGQVTTIGHLGVDPFNFGAFDIQQGTNIGFAALNISSVPTLVRVDLFTGQAYVLGRIGDGDGRIDGLAIPLVWAPTVGPSPTPTPSAAHSTLRVIPTVLRPGEETDVLLELTALGGESRVEFSIRFDPDIFSDSSVLLGSGVPAGTNLTVDRSLADTGRIGVRLICDTGFPSGNLKILKIRVTPPVPLVGGSTIVSFSRDPIMFNTIGLDGRVFETSYVPANMFVDSNYEALANISGRVTNRDGRGLAGASVSITDSTGKVRSVRASSFGHYSITGIAAASTYVVQARSRGFEALPRLLQVTGHVTNFDLVIN